MNNVGVVRKRGWAATRANLGRDVGAGTGAEVREGVKSQNKQ